MQRDRVVWPAVIGRSGRRQRSKLAHIAVGAMDRQLNQLAGASGARHLDIAFRAVDFPQQVGAARHAAAVMDRECGPALGRAMFMGCIG